MVGNIAERTKKAANRMKSRGEAAETRTPTSRRRCLLGQVRKVEHPLLHQSLLHFSDRRSENVLCVSCLRISIALRALLRHLTHHAIRPTLRLLFASKGDAFRACPSKKCLREVGALVTAASPRLNIRFAAFFVRSAIFPTNKAETAICGLNMQHGGCLACHVLTRCSVALLYLIDECVAYIAANLNQFACCFIHTSS